MRISFAINRKRRGSLSVVVLMILAGFTLAAMWHLVISTTSVQLSVVERSRSQVLSDHLLAADLLQDAAYACGNLAAGYDGTQLGRRIQERLDLIGLARPHRRFRLISWDSERPVAGWFGAPRASGETALSAEWTSYLESTGLRNVRYAEKGGTGRVVLESAHPWSGAAVPMQFQVTPLTLPMIWAPTVGYSRMQDLGGSGDIPVHFPSVLGATEHEDVSHPGTLPSSARSHVALLGSAYAGLFSPERLQMLSDLAAPTHRIVMGEDPSGIPITQPELVGVQWPNAFEVRLDLARIGTGRRLSSSGETIQDSSVLLIDGSLGGSVRLEDTGGALRTPIVCVVLGPPSGFAQELRVHIGTSLTRPLVLVLCGVRLTSAPGRLRAQALLYLDPDCKASIPGEVEVAHLSADSRSLQGLLRGGLRASQPITDDLQRAAPRALLVRVNGAGL